LDIVELESGWSFFEDPFLFPGAEISRTPLVEDFGTVESQNPPVWRDEIEVGFIHTKKSTIESGRTIPPEAK